MIKIRRGVFETNSSSSHSLTRNYSQKTKSTFTEKSIEVLGGEYGWVMDVLSTPLEKLNYVAIACIEMDSDWKPKNLNTSKRGKWLKKAIKEYCGTEIILDNVGGYIDHNSTGMLGLPSIEKEFKEKVLDIIFDDSYIIVLGNDNSGEMAQW